jgi:glutamate--cysteine ligase
MEQFFDRSGPWGRVMMCSTASVQVCVDAGQEQSGPSGFRWRWHLLHGLGPVLVASFANSPFQDGRMSGWKSTRQAVWSRLDPSRTRAPADAEPGAADRGPRWPEDTDPREDWVSYVLDAQVMLLRDPGSRRWTAPTGLTFRDWVRGAAGPPPTADDLTYHLSTLFPPVRPRGHLELRVIDAQPGDGWIVPTAVVSALLDDPVAAQAAMAAVEPLQKDTRPGELLLRAARHGQDDPQLATASRECFAAADAGLVRLGAPASIRDAVTGFADRYVLRGRCPADDRLDEARAAVSLLHHPRNPDACLEESP